MQDPGLIMVSARLPEWLSDAIKQHALDTRRRIRDVMAEILEAGLPAKTVAAAKRRAGR